MLQQTKNKIFLDSGEMKPFKSSFPGPLGLSFPSPPASVYATLQSTLQHPKKILTLSSSLCPAFEIFMSRHLFGVLFCHSSASGTSHFYGVGFAKSTKHHLVTPPFDLFQMVIGSSILASFPS